MNSPATFFNEQRIFIIIGVLLALHLSACTTSTEFPVGTFDCEVCQGYTMRFLDDGSYDTHLMGFPYVTGRWHAEGNTFYVGDSFCNDEDEMPASYKWSFNGEILNFHVIEDKCLDRRSSLDEKPWKLRKEKQ